ncbi:F1F0 ATP synthase subunit e, mitochondrial [Friedmanniomyces endolithicus]|nr:F1F0 ATP synthase subunit e, mitochondrial [Friedmanniomyces endolithicus]
MASSGVNLLRWSALAVGVFYGFSHQNAIHSRDKKAVTQHEWDRKAQIIDQAKAEWKKRNDPDSGKDNGGEHVLHAHMERKCFRRESCAVALEDCVLTTRCAVISDPQNPKFDLEAYLNDVHARNG